MVRVRDRAVALALTLAASLTGLAAQSAPKPPAGLTEPERSLFDAHCGICHARTGYATSILAARLGRKRALLAERTDLGPDGIKAVVRGGTGSMPPQTRVDLSDADLDRIAAYLTSGRSGRRPAAGRKRR
jgi:mono/diheme cytochrome c family protein